MLVFKRFVPPALLTLLLLAVIPGSAAAGGGGGGFTPGVFHFSDDLADAELLSQGDFAEIDVTQGSFLANLRNGSGVTIQNGTVLGVSLFTSTVSGFGCYTIPSGDFSLSQDLHTATLHTTLPAGTPPLSGVAQLAIPGGHGITPFAGGGGGGVGCGGGTGFPTSVTIDATWTYEGIVSNRMDNSTFSCQETSIVSHSTFDRAPTTVQVRFSGVTDTFGLSFSAVARDTVDANMLGTTPSIQCFF